MSDEAPLKSAYELAMERLRSKDRAEGVSDHAPLSAAQKRAIAQARQAAEAKRAELEILHRDAVNETAGDAEKLAELERRYEIDRRRVDADLESKLTRIRRGK